MRSLLFIPLLFLSTFLFSQEIRSVHFQELKKEFQLSGDTLLLLNFWATWCKPCVDELPYFEKVNDEYKNQKVKTILVNLDFNSKLSSVTLPFIQRKNLKSAVYHILDTDPNEWINQVDTSWSGAIPATLMYLNGQKIFFHEGALSEQQLVWEVEKILEERSKNEFQKN